jgi:hypothetical protein
VESQDKQLSTLIPKYRQQHIRNPEEEFHPQLVIHSSTELFHHYRVTLAQCAKLSTGGRLLELSQTFGKYLDTYSQQVLSYFLADKTGGPSIEDAVIILNTADYCYHTTNQLEEKIKARIDEDLREKVDMQSQADSFIGVASATVRAMVAKTEADCSAAWREMRNVPWSKMESVGDQSGYVAYLLQRVNDRSKEILKYIQKPQYARAYCDNLVDSLTNTYIINIVAVRPISETGAEQMLLDSYVLKKGLGELATINSEPGTPLNQAFIKRVNQGMSKLDPILKTLQVRSSPSEGLVQAYLIHIRDRSEANFRKMLELKGITKKDQVHLVELFNAHKASSANESLQASNPLIASLQLLNQPSTTTGGLTILKDSTISNSNPSLPSRFDPSNFGTAIMNAARDAGDRFGSPNIGIGSGSNTTNVASRTTSPTNEESGINGDASAQTGTKTLNENLKNFGNFFRRDTGGFSGFASGFGRREWSGSGGEKK